MRIKAKLLGATQFNDNLNEKKAVLPISVSKLYHEGDKFIATIELVKKRFSQCDIIVSDTLQRYNLLNSHTMEEAAEITYNLGTEWIERNIHLLDNSPSPIKIIRWNECLNFDGFKPAFDKILHQFINDESFQTAIMIDIKAFINRKKTDRESDNTTNHCISYILEEAAVVISYFIHQQYDFIVYPSAIPKFIEKCRDLFLPIEAHHLIRNLRVYFKKVTSELIA